MRQSDQICLVDIQCKAAPDSWQMMVCRLMHYGTMIVQGACNATTGDLEEAGGAFEAQGLTAFVSGC